MITMDSVAIEAKRTDVILAPAPSLPDRKR
jgi:hypothetical protein